MLPANRFDAPPDSDAYAQCMLFEKKETVSPAHVREDAIPPIVCARLLAYLLCCAPTPEGRHNIANEINHCDGNSEKLIQLAGRYVCYIALCCECLSFMYSFIDLNRGTNASQMPYRMQPGPLSTEVS
jgi:hypothetical protein